MNNYYPDNLKAFPLWGLWKAEDSGDHMRKKPFSACGLSWPLDVRPASTANPRDWTTFGDALDVFSQRTFYDGIGLLIHPDYSLVFVDIDDCISADGDFDERARMAFDCFPSTFIEKSQSGRGLHVLAFGDIPRNFKNSAAGVEMYRESRFCAMTGDAVQPLDVVEQQKGLDIFFDTFKTDEPSGKNPNYGKCPRSDDWIIYKLTTIQRGMYARLYFTGDWKAEGYESQSDADMAILGRLAFLSKRDPDAMRRVFMTSALAESRTRKSDFNDYLGRTVETACMNAPDTFFDHEARCNLYG